MKLNNQGAKFLGLLVAVSLTGLLSSNAYAVDEGKAVFNGDFRMRYENVSQDNALADAEALTLGARLMLRSARRHGFSIAAELESNIELIDDYSVPPAGVRPGEFSVIADPQSTEIDQAYVSYKTNRLDAKLGRQVYTLDGHRFVGHVGWRQDRQTFDGVSIGYQSGDNLMLNAAYFSKRNRIFADEKDVDSKDTLLNASYKTSYGKFVAYAYLLEVDNNTTNSLDTYGVSFKGSTKVGGHKLSYSLEMAKQDTSNAYDTDYFALEGAYAVGGISAKVGYEVLGSDDGQIGFATPLATLHKYNGWADQFLATPSVGLEDLYVGVSGKALGGKWAAIYHDYSSDAAVQGSGDLGDEINLVYSRKFGKGFSGGAKLANYSAGASEFNKVDADKVWVWAGYKF